MTEILKETFDKVWGKYISLLIFLPICILGTLGLITTDGSPLRPTDYIIIATVAFVYFSYAVFVCYSNRLPRAKTVNRTILFVIFAESNQLFDDIKKKLISEFCSCINNGGSTVFEAKYVNADRLKKYNLDKKADVISLLTLTNCAFIVRVKYIVDDVANVDNYSMQINCGIVHPELTEQAQSLLQHDMNVLANPISKRKFKKNQIIDEFEFTAQRLSVMCTYVIGLVEVFAGNSDDAYILFKKLYSEHKLPSDQKEEIFCDATKGWLYICCMEIACRCIREFQSNKDLSKLEEGNRYLEEANALHPETYDYYLQKAYYYVASKRDIPSASKCIAECRKSNAQPSWKYSDAFLAAYRELSASTIISKYKSAFKADTRLLQIIDYVEYIIENDTDKVGLHLAAALLYSQIPDEKLQAEHLAIYFEKEKNIKNKETAKRHFSKNNSAR